MARDADVDHGRVAVGGGQQGGTGDDTVHDGRDASGPGLEQVAGQSGDLESADLGQQVASPAHERLLDDGNLAGEHGVVDARSPARHLGDRATRVARDQRGRRCGVADAHVTRDEALRPAIDKRGGDVPPDGDRLRDLVVGHRRFDGQVSGAGAHLAGQQADGGLELGCHTHVDHHNLGASLATEHVDGRSSGTEVEDHLGSHFLRPRCDTLGDHAVVAGEDGDDRTVRHRRRALAGDPG